MTPIDYQLLFERGPGLYMVLTPDLRIATVSDAYAQATMIERAKVAGRGLFEVFPDNPHDPAATGVANLKASLERVIATGVVDAMAVQQYDVRRPDGSGFEQRHWSPVNHPIFGADGRLAFILHRAEDVTDFVRDKRATEELRTHAGRMEAEVYRRAQQIQEANEKLEERVRERTKALTNEMSERERVEEQFRQAQKMEAVGQLAGGVAHDFNNLLTVILSYSRFVRDGLSPGSGVLDDVGEIEKSAQRAALLTQQLLAFSRKQVLERKVLSLNDVVADSENMLRRLIGEDVDLLTVLAPDLGQVKADRGHLDQVLMNLLVNARDAMPDGGKVTIETANAELDDEYTRGHLGAKSGAYVMLAVSDTGVGMAPDVQSRIFLPFFTTKDQGKGTGLGLAMVHGVVKQSGGEIIVYSTPGKGTTFKIYLPRVDAVDTGPRATAIARRPHQPTETVLVVEDEDLVRAAAERSLRKAGYRVLTAPTPVDALKDCADMRVRFDLLVSDVVMPGMDGPTLARQLLAQRPGMKVLFMSGYTGGALMHHGVIESEFAYLQKPFTPDLLVAKVREVLEGV